MSAAAPLVSVALATYNGDKFLRQQLNSIYAQTHRNIEVVVSDDHSVDGTAGILEEYRRSHGLIYRINEANLGYPNNFEKAMSLCNGDYIALADQDDVFLPEKIQTLVGEIGSYSLIYSDAALIDADGRLFAPSYMRYANFPMLTGKPFKELVFSCFIRGFQILCTRDLLMAALPLPRHVTHDDWLTILAAKRDGIKYLDRPLVHYRQHRGNVTGTLTRSSALQEFADMVGHFGNRRARGDRRNYVRAILEKLDALLANRAFDDDEKKFISEVAMYYRDQLDSTVHWRSFLIALRNFRVAVPHKNVAFKAKFLLASLVRQ